LYRLSCTACLFLIASIAGAQNKEFPDTPQPNIVHPRNILHFSRPVIVLGLTQGATMAFDGAVTHCDNSIAANRITGFDVYCHEADPIARLFIGDRPTWKRMIPIGAAFSIGAALIAEKMHRSERKWVHRLWWLPQVVLLATSGAGIASRGKPQFQ